MLQCAWWFCRLIDWLIGWLTDWLPSWVEVSKGVGHVAGHAGNNGPFTAQIFDHDGRQEHGGDDDGGVDDAQRRDAHPLLCVQTALQGEGQGVDSSKDASVENTFSTINLKVGKHIVKFICFKTKLTSSVVKWQ